jgi:hypothetical protein
LGLHPRQGAEPPEEEIPERGTRRSDIKSFGDRTIVLVSEPENWFEEFKQWVK